MSRYNVFVLLCALINLGVAERIFPYEIKNSSLTKNSITVLENLNKMTFWDYAYLLKESWQQLKDLVPKTLGVFGAPNIINDFQSGRKKKYKKQGGMMMSFVIIAMVAQVVLGKIIFLAAASLVMSKAALLFSAVNGLKKSTSTQPEVYVEPHNGYGNTAYN